MTIACPRCGQTPLAGARFCIRCGVPLGSAQEAPAPLSGTSTEGGPARARPGIDQPLMQSTPFDMVGSVVFRPSPEQPFLGSLEIEGPDGVALGQLVRDGTGLRVFLMNFLLTDAAGRPLFFIRQPSHARVSFRSTPFDLVDPGGITVGQLAMKAGFSTRFSMLRRSEEVLWAQRSGFGWKGYSVMSGDRPIATASVFHPFFRSPGDPGGTTLQFLVPSSTELPRIQVVAFVAFACIFGQNRQFSGLTIQ